jgi:hypothetical protein
MCTFKYTFYKEYLPCGCFINNGFCGFAKAELIILFFMKPKVVTTTSINILRVETRYFTEG